LFIHGDNDVSIIGNQYDNIVWGNQGANNFIGGGNNDYFFGNEGIDRASYAGEYDEYAILFPAEWNDYTLSVVDFYSERDGVDTLGQVEELDFNGVVYTVAGILNADDLPLLPSKIKMLPNYPNPFNPVTNIKFELPEETYVSIRVVDVLGRLVRSLINEKRIAGGYHHIKWDGLADSGTSASSGVYLIHFSSNNYNKYYKALLIK
tara:strand:- start:17246 stop:17863 length:618 start_codon:yes stop_codon:yes gene_type:complete